MKKLIATSCVVLGLMSSGFAMAQPASAPKLTGNKQITSLYPHIVLNENHTTFTVKLLRKDTDNYIWKVIALPDWLVFKSHSTEYTVASGAQAVENFTFEMDPYAMDYSHFSTLKFGLRHANDGTFSWEYKDFSVDYYAEF